MFDGIMFRGYSHNVVKTLSEYAGVPVWNGLCDEYHPTQVLADLLTLQENFGELRGLPVTYVGDGRNNQATSLLIVAAKMGLDFRILAPEALYPSAATMKLLDECCEGAPLGGGSLPGERICVSGRGAQAAVASNRTRTAD